MSRIAAGLLCIILLGSLTTSVLPWRDDDRAREGRYERDYRHDRRSRSALPDRFTIDKPGKCELRCERRRNGEYQCREYRC
jgi:hypothetical protein